HVNDTQVTKPARIIGARRTELLSSHTPDFAVMLATGEMELHEVKGFWTDDARVKTKVAADQYPFRIIGVTVKPKKAGGGWIIEEF
ncbi:hypothetical protein R9Q35_14440, partial [Escherichia coli]